MTRFSGVDMSVHDVQLWLKFIDIICAIFDFNATINPAVKSKIITYGMFRLNSDLASRKFHFHFLFSRIVLLQWLHSSVCSDAV